ncbi:MAG TPA: Nif3-like dinuclear metal center hexameric protein [Microbacteriaceae bacterium]|nr:Nif3-like dinuclear metal center hexameric protein [Microbacteriaceae bacterium]
MQNLIKLSDVRDTVQKLWPEQAAESWDRVGLTVGSNETPVKKILFAVDAVRDTVTEAINWGADLIFTHHPLMLRGIHTVAEDTYKGALIADLIRNRCALLSAHTNADVPVGGVSDAIADAIGLVNTEPIEPGLDSKSGLGRIGYLKAEITLEDLALRLTKALPKTAVGARVAGQKNKPVYKVALLGGSGDSLLTHPKVQSSDVYITSDLRHHPAQEALEQASLNGGPALIDVAHWASESLWLKDAARQLKEELPGVETRVSEINTDPWIFRVG